MEYILSKITNARDEKKMVDLLEKEGILKDANLDYSIGVFDDEYNLLATGSTFKNTLRCMAVDSSHQGEGLLNMVVSALIEHEHECGYHDLFLYTKIDSSKFFMDLGFYEIAKVSDKLVFMENKKDAFSSYIDGLSSIYKPGNNGAIVMNANPFTLGHKYLVEKAVSEVDNLYIFVVSEDVSDISFKTRFDLVVEGTKEYSNVTVIPSGDYIISEATFPSYFLKDDELVARSHASLDATIFTSISKVLNIKKRFVGTEPYSTTTSIYNEVLKSTLPSYGVDVIEIPRLETGEKAISASLVREALNSGDDKTLKEMLPDSSYTNLVIKVLR